MVTSSVWHKLCDPLNKLRDFLIRIYVHILYLMILASFVIFSLLGFEIGESAYFYTLSTISQTLAALIGIVAIFVIFKLDMLKTKRSDSIKRLEILLQSDTASCAGSYYSEKRYKVICSIIGDFFTDSTIDDVILDNYSSAITKLELEPNNRAPMDDLIKYSKKPIGDINKIDGAIKDILSRFAGLAVVVLSAIILSILALPFGWFTAPVGSSLNLSVPKMPLVGAIVYLAVVSIFQTARFIDYVIKSKY